MPYRFSKDEMREHWAADNPRRSTASAADWAAMGVPTSNDAEDRRQRRLQRSKERTPGTPEAEDREAAKRGRYFVRRKNAAAERQTPGLMNWLQESDRQFQEHKAANPHLYPDHHHRRQWLAENPGFDSQDYEDHMWIQNNPGVHPVQREIEKAQQYGHEYVVNVSGDKNPASYPADLEHREIDLRNR